MLVVVPRAQEHRRWVFNDKDAGKTLNVCVGDTVIIRLPATPSSGSVWQLTASSGGSATEKTRFDLVEKAKPGAKAEQVFQFIVQKPGQHELRFSYRRGEASLQSSLFKLNAH